ncbi:MAG: arylsulfatase, partial [Planctomycetales bacterium]|nr:arylsulfatase [Planctomycetales bacterium]
GIRFTDFYAGCTVCAPSRSVLMTGQHMGHTHVRGNAGGNIDVQTLRPEDVTVAEVLKQADYATALCGKWGLGDDAPGNTGLPNDQGFDYFYGYLNQVHAHNYYPEFLWRNKEKSPLRNEVVSNGSKYANFAGGYATKRIDYSHDLVCDEALRFIERSQDGPFFLYLALTIPHANNEGTRGTGNGQEVPDYGIYADRDWPNPEKGFAAMIARMDADVGRLFQLLRDLAIDDNTLVIFTSDNGPHNEGNHDHEFFDSNGPLTGFKRSMHEGGIRVPMIARWPGQIKSGSQSDLPSAFWDFLPTACEAAGVEPPDDIDGVSYLPTLLGEPEKQTRHEYLYWASQEGATSVGVRRGLWKLVRYRKNRDGAADWRLYNLRSDIGEKNDVSIEHPEQVKDIFALLRRDGLLDDSAQ